MLLPLRMAVLGYLYCRTDAPYRHPSELKGKRIGSPAFRYTVNLWLRGMLAEHYDLAPQDMSWVTNEAEINGYQIPSNIDVSVVPGTGPGQLLIDGEIDAIITYRHPQVFTDCHPHIGRLFQDFRTAEQAYYKKTGIFPIMHVVGIRDDLLAEHPWIAANVMNAFEEAKKRAMEHLTDLDALAVTLPWLVAEAEDTKALMGEDFWPYGTAKNLAAIAAQTRWSVEQGISPRQLDLEDIFVPSTL